MSTLREAAVPMTAGERRERRRNWPRGGAVSWLQGEYFCGCHHMCMMERYSSEDTKNGFGIRRRRPFIIRR